jgi:hypothetical protein
MFPDSNSNPAELVVLNDDRAIATAVARKLGPPVAFVALWEAAVLCRHRRLESQDPVAYAASEARCRQRLEALLLAQGQSVMSVAA